MSLTNQETLQINQALFSLTHAYESRMVRENLPEQTGLTLFDCAVLMVIGQFSPIQSSELAQRMDVSPSTISIYVRRLSQKGIVRMERNLQDRRIWWLRLTETGHPVYLQIIAGTIKYTQDFLSVLNIEEQQILLEMLKKTTHALGYTWL
jgi:MarR family transcriptional regulator, organic hydroperoxide resistance regulator